MTCLESQSAKSKGGSQSILKERYGLATVDAPQGVSLNSDQLRVITLTWLRKRSDPAIKAITSQRSRRNRGALKRRREADCMDVAWQQWAHSTNAWPIVLGNLSNLQCFYCRLSM